jgi:hypothetical protein
VSTLHVENVPDLKLGDFRMLPGIFILGIGHECGLAMAPTVLPDFCKKMYDAAGLGWPADGPVLVHSGAKPNRVLYAVEPNGTKHMVYETIPPTPAEDRDFVPELVDPTGVDAVIASVKRRDEPANRGRVQERYNALVAEIERLRANTTPDLSALKAASLQLNAVLFDASTRAMDGDLFEAWREWVVASSSAGLLTETKREPEPLEVAREALQKIAEGQSIFAASRLAHQALAAIRQGRKE